MYVFSMVGPIVHGSFGDKKNKTKTGINSYGIYLLRK
jgi:hypothetical protein